MKIQTILVILLTLIQLVSCEQSFTCANNTKLERTSTKSGLKQSIQKMLFVVSYSVLMDSGSLPHDLIPQSIISGEEQERFYKFGIRRNTLSLVFNRNASQSTITVLRPFEGFEVISTNEPCADKYSKALRTTQDKLIMKLKHSSVLLYGCEVRSIMEGNQRKMKVEKSVILIDNNMVQNENVLETMLETHKMTNIKYKNFASRGFCICDDIIDYLKCDDNEPSENISGFIAVCSLAFTAITLFVAVRIFREYFRNTDESLEEIHIEMNEMPPVPEPVPPAPESPKFITAFDLKKKLEEQKRLGFRRIDALVEENYF
jgi:hypothetical protein